LQIGSCPVLHFNYPRSATGTPCTRSTLAMGYMVKDSRVMRRELSWGLGLFGCVRFVLATGERSFRPSSTPAPPSAFSFHPGSRRRGDGRQMHGSWLAHYSPACPRSRGLLPFPIHGRWMRALRLLPGYTHPGKKNGQGQWMPHLWHQGKGINQGFSQLCTAGVTCTMRQCHSIVVVRSCSCSAVVHSTVH
jgi:hypothetical protein